MREFFVVELGLATDDIVRLAIAFVLFGVSLFAFLRTRGVATTFLLVGSAAYLGKQLFWDFLHYLVTYALVHPGVGWVRFFYPTDANAPWTTQVALALLFLSILFPLGVIIFLVEAVRKHL